MGLAEKPGPGDLASHRALLAIAVSLLAIEVKSIGETSKWNIENGSRK